MLDGIHAPNLDTARLARISTGACLRDEKDCARRWVPILRFDFDFGETDPACKPECTARFGLRKDGKVWRSIRSHQGMVSNAREEIFTLP